MLPNAAQGACQTLEDAAALGRALERLPAEQALHAYQVERLERANGLVRQSRLTARVAQSGNPVLPAIRNFAMGHIPRSVLVGQLDRVMRA
jgi:2-polyprenyl-6-methoxyphenol hydroxylase-like FAD-dependent oxidoreductase